MQCQGYQREERKPRAQRGSLLKSEKGGGWSPGGRQRRRGLSLQKACGLDMVEGQEVVSYSIGGGRGGGHGSWGRMQVWCRCGPGGWSVGVTVRSGRSLSIYVQFFHQLMYILCHYHLPFQVSILLCIVQANSFLQFFLESLQITNLSFSSQY